MAAAAETGGARLRTSSIGLWDVVFQSITYMAPGVGLVFSIGIGIPFAGETLPLAVAIGLLACTLTAVAIGQCAKYVPSAGGIYTYAAKGLNPSFGFYIGWLYVGFAAFLPVFLFTLNGYLIDLTLKQQNWPGASWSKWWIWTILTIIVVFFLTYFDVRISGKAGIILGVIEIAIFVALSAWMIVDNSSYNSLSYFNPSNSAQGTKGLFIGAVYGILAFIGFEAAAALGEEARDPSRTVPRGVIYSCVGIGLYYVFCCYAWNVGAGATGIIKHYNDNGFNSWVPFAKEFWGSAWILVFLALVNSNIACASAAVNNAGRVLFSMGRIGALPSFIGKVHPHHRTPYWGVIATIILSTIMSFILAAKFGADFAYAVAGTMFTVLAIVIYMVACASCVGYFSKEGREHRNVLLHVVIPIAGIIVFVPAMYAQYFSFDQLFKWAVVYPFNWSVITALVWLGAGVLITLWMRSQRPESLAKATAAFGGESDELAHDGQAESMSLGH
jgi:amino acid transporter